MARTRIYKADGKPTRYFWSDKDGNDATRKRVYKQTDDGIKRAKSLRFDVAKNRFHKN